MDPMEFPDGSWKPLNPLRKTSHKLMGSVEKVSENQPNSLEWQSFFTNDLPLLLSACIDARHIRKKQGDGAKGEGVGTEDGQRASRDL